ncbi:F0F1 ATP synthase subunit I [Serratia symbiotica]|uniref:F0F1 ATP synthase subunit I n=1 Tax=Serratia symbiotica TaxID=138074 RepID=UPI001D860030|nr:F0F1 ATP synthase subunit I [Serratia symbiotica]NIG88196.1 F0F1 ATP synthase subunit I [Serratia symbiotica]USS96840.1 F0F1 ATP synthase subunit I [Serratia symbiotica]
MSVSIYSGKIALKLLFFQLMTFVLISTVFLLKSLEWSVSALVGGIAAWLPSVMFMLFALCHPVQMALSGRVAWLFAIGEGLKVASTIIFLIVALGVFKVAFIPLGLAYLAALMVQIVAPAMINSYRT